MNNQIKENNKKIVKIKISIIVNVLIVIMTAFAIIAMFTGFKFMNTNDSILDTTKIDMLKYFTVQSNLFVGIVSLIFAIKQYKILKGKKEEIELKYYVLKLMSTTAVGLTFFAVFTYLGPFTKYGLPAMLMNSNLFFHLIIPVLSIINFVFFEKTDKLKFKHVLWGLLPTFLYQIFYSINVLIHMENGKISYVYDWYLFLQKGTWIAIIGVPLFLLLTFFISLLIWKFNRKKQET